MTPHSFVYLFISGLCISIAGGVLFWLSEHKVNTFSNALNKLRTSCLDISKPVDMINLMEVTQIYSDKNNEMRLIGLVVLGLGLIVSCLTGWWIFAKSDPSSSAGLYVFSEGIVVIALLMVIGKFVLNKEPKVDR